MHNQGQYPFFPPGSGINSVPHHPAMIAQNNYNSSHVQMNDNQMNNPQMAAAAVTANNSANQNFHKAQLWQMIEKIGEQFDQIKKNQQMGRRIDPNLDPVKFNEQHQKLTRLISLRKKCLEAEKSMREKQLALMRERNLYLEKCRQIEEYGESVDWGGEPSYEEDFNSKPKMGNDDQILLQEVYDILYTEK